LLLLIVSFSIATVPFIEGQAQAIASPEVLTEVYLDQVPVSGSILSGIQYSTSSDSAGKSLWVRIPRPAIGKLRISVITDDGRYSAAAQFNLSALSSGEQLSPPGASWSVSYAHKRKQPASVDSNFLELLGRLELRKIDIHGLKFVRHQIEGSCDDHSDVRARPHRV
jgi:hypothetical protein